MHLVLRVQTDDALRLETETTADRLREQLRTANIAGATSPSSSPTEFRVDGVPADQDRPFRQAADRHRADVQPLASGAGTYTFTMRPNIAVQLRDEAVTQALQTIERRVNELGVAEPIVARHSGADQILVQLPGVTDVARAKDIIRSTALLELKLVEQGPFSDEAAARQAYTNNVPPDLQILPGTSEGTPATAPSTVYYVVRRVPAVTGRDLRNARPSLDENSRPAVSFSLNNEGAAKFGTFTAGQHQPPARHRPRQPRPLGADASRRASTTKAASPATSPAGSRGSVALLRSGALPALLTYLEERTVGAVARRRLDSRGVLASIGGLVFVHAVHAGLLQARRASTRSSRSSST